MDRLTQWVVLTVAAVLVVLTGGWFLLVAPRHDEAAALRQQTQSQTAANSSLRMQLQVLKSQAKDLPRQKTRLAAIGAKVPSTPSLPALIRALDALSTSAGVRLETIAPSVPTTAAAAGSAALPTPGPATTAAAAPTALVIPVNVDVSGGYFQVQQFLHGLEDLPRAMRVGSVNITTASGAAQPGEAAAAAKDGRTLLAQLQTSVFFLPDATSSPVPAGAVAGAVTPTPAAATGSPAAAAPAAPARPVAAAGPVAPAAAAPPADAPAVN